MNIIAIIPARMNATRFPGKPMALIHGLPMIQHVYKRTLLSNLVTATYVATCDEEIFNYIKSTGGNVVMTGHHHERCSDRTAEALLKIEDETRKPVDIVVMVQGDEPMVFPDMVDHSVNVLLQDRTLNISCLMARINTSEVFEDPNQVKVVVDLNQYALYFSREPIPSRKKGGSNIPMFKQVPIISFQRDYLLKFNSLSPTPLEIIESVDMMRILEHGEKLKMVITERETLSVDTPEDLVRVNQAMIKDVLFSSYRDLL